MIISSHNNNDKSNNNNDDNNDDNSNNYDDDDDDDNNNCYDNDIKLTILILLQLLTLVLLSITAPLSTKNIATSNLPQYAAQFSGVHPSYEKYA